MARIPIGLQTWPADTQLTAENLVNCYAEQAPQTARTPVRIRGGWDGSTFSSPPSSASYRWPLGYYAWNDTLFMVMAGYSGGAISATGALFELSGTPPTTTFTNRGAVTIQTYADGAENGGRPVSMAGLQGDKLIIATEADIYSWNGTTLTDISATSNLPSTVGWVAELNNRIIYGEKDEATFVWSDPGDSTTIDSLATLTATGAQGDILVGKVSNRELFCFKRHSIEVFYDTGDSLNTFVRSGSGLIQRGAVSPYGVAEMNGTLFFVADDRKIYSLTGRTLTPISTPGIELDLQSRTLSDAEAFAFSYGGSYFIVFNFPDGSTTKTSQAGKNPLTYIYDLKTQLWHKREVSASIPFWQTRNAFHFGGYVYTGDRDGAPEYFTESDYTQPYAMIVDTPFIENGGKRIHMARLEAHVEVDTSASGSPTVELLTSKDGSTWNSHGTRSLGTTSTSDTRCVWHRRGQFRKRALRLSITGVDNTPVLYYVEAELQPEDY